MLPPLLAKKGLGLSWIMEPGFIFRLGRVCSGRGQPSYLLPAPYWKRLQHTASQRPPSAQQGLMLHQPSQMNVWFRGESLSWAKKEELTPVCQSWEPAWAWGGSQDEEKDRRERPPRLAGKKASWSAPATGGAGRPRSLHKGTSGTPEATVLTRQGTPTPWLGPWTARV